MNGPIRHPARVIVTAVWLRERASVATAQSVLSDATSDGFRSCVRMQRGVPTPGCRFGPAGGCRTSPPPVLESQLLTDALHQSSMDLLLQVILQRHGCMASAAAEPCPACQLGPIQDGASFFPMKVCESMEDLSYAKARLGLPLSSSCNARTS